MPAHDSTLRDSLHVKAHAQQTLPTVVGLNNTWADRLIRGEIQRFYSVLKKKKGRPCWIVNLETAQAPLTFQLEILT